MMHKKHYSTVELYIRSFLYTALSITTIILYSITLIFAVIIPLRARHALIRLFLQWNLSMLKYICHIDYEIEGKEHIPTDRAGVVMAKHQSIWETYYIPILFHCPAMIAKRELAWLPFFGWALAASKPILINRQKKQSAMQQIIRQGSKCLKEKRWVVFFPEGTRMAYGTVGQYKLGGARLAVATESFIIPVAHNAGKCWPRRKFIKQPGTIRMVIGPAIEAKNKEPDELLAETKAWIEGTMQRL